VVAEPLKQNDFGTHPRHAKSLIDSHLPAITTQQSCGNDGVMSLEENVIGRDGISKTTVWKKCVSFGNFALAETFHSQRFIAACPSLPITPGVHL
jgi:hypothetical protein